MKRITLSVIAAISTVSCSQAPNPDWAKCPILEEAFVDGNADVKAAQVCMDRNAASLANGPDSAETVASAAANMCSEKIRKITADIGDIVGREKAHEDRVRLLKARSSAVVVQVRTWKCLDNPAYSKAVQAH